MSRPGAEAAASRPRPERPSDETMERTWRACAWLIGIAEEGVKSTGLDPVVVRWLDKLGSHCYEQLGGSADGLH